jgi:hypothetical protein
MDFHESLRLNSEFNARKTDFTWNGRSGSFSLKGIIATSRDRPFAHPSA